uniref:Uncharacterized protein n=1 Tax=Anopheles merus TaxID=30066 RepID=A0A182VH19_ANOME
MQHIAKQPPRNSDGEAREPPWEDQEREEVRGEWEVAVALLGTIEHQYGALQQTVPVGRYAGLQMDGTEQCVIVLVRVRLFVQLDANVHDPNPAHCNPPYVPPVDGVGQRELGRRAELQQLQRLLLVERQRAHLVAPLAHVAVRVGAHDAQALVAPAAVRLQHQPEVDRGRVAAPVRVAHDQIVVAREVAREQALVAGVVAQLQAGAAVERPVKVVRPVGERVAARAVLERGRVRDGRLEVLLGQVEPALGRLRPAQPVVELARPETERAVERELHGAAHVQVAPQPVPEAVVHLQKQHVPVVRLEPVPAGRFLQRLERPAGREQCDREREAQHLLERGVRVHLRLLAAAEHVDPDVHVQPPVRAVVADVALRPLELLPVPGVVEEDAVAREKERVVRTVQLVLPLEPAGLGDRVVPDDQAARDLRVAPLGQQLHEVAQQPDLARLQPALDVQQPAVKLAHLRHGHERFHHAPHKLLRLQDVPQQLHVLVLHDQRPDHLHAVPVRTVEPLQRRHRHEMVAKVAEDVDRGPVVEPIVDPALLPLHPVDVPVVQVVALEVVAEQDLRPRLVRHLRDRPVRKLQHLVAVAEMAGPGAGRDRLDQVLPRVRPLLEVEQRLQRQDRLAHLRICTGGHAVSDWLRGRFAQRECQRSEREESSGAR